MEWFCAFCEMESGPAIHQMGYGFPVVQAEIRAKLEAALEEKELPKDQ